MAALEAQQAVWARQTPVRQTVKDQACRQAAQYLIRACPTIRRGWWCDPELITSTESTSKVYERKGWYATWANGETTITMEDGTLCMTEDFVNIYG